MVGSCQTAIEVLTEVRSASEPASTATIAWPPIRATWTNAKTGAPMAGGLYRTATKNVRGPGAQMMPRP
ncbi:MAG: hypothetical protein LH645_09550, partial [Actinomycetia bacterium]|nr:hypothetical protein [Actinomycetes bacterium]